MSFPLEPLTYLVNKGEKNFIFYFSLSIPMVYSKINIKGIVPFPLALEMCCLRREIKEILNNEKKNVICNDK